MASFKEEFARARKAKGPGKTFPWRGKTYSTNTASDSGKSSAPTSSPRPPPAGAIGAARGRQGAAAGAAAAASVRERLPQVEASTEGRPFMPKKRAVRPKRKAEAPADKPPMKIIRGRAPAKADREARAPKAKRRRKSGMY